MSGEAGMNWGDAPTWVASLAAVAVAVRAELKARRAEREAREAREINTRQAVAQERMVAIADQRLKLAEDAALGAAAGTSSEPEVAFEVEWLGGNTYALRNIGTGTATGVTVDPAAFSPVTGGLPDGQTLGPLRSHRILAVPTMGHPLPTEIEVRANELLSPSVVRWPART